MDWWDRMNVTLRRLWLGLAGRLGIRGGESFQHVHPQIKELRLLPSLTQGILLHGQTETHLRLQRLKHDVRTCEYEDVRVMWEMLNRTESEMAKSPAKPRKKSLWRVFMFPNRVPYLCRRF